MEDKVIASYEADESREYSLSYEIFPPRTESGQKKLPEVVKKLEATRPNFISVTYGAGGQDLRGNLETVKYIKQKTLTYPLAHLTCANTSKKELFNMIDHYLSCQIRLFLALRGDIAVDRPVANDWTTAEFVEALRRRNRNYLRHDRNTQIHALANPLTIAVACFPGGNSALGTDNQGEVDRLLEKQDAGADFAISQVFYKPQVFDEFMTLARKQGVTIPIIAGILPQNNLIGIQKSAKILGVSAPTDILAFFAKLEETEDGQELITKYYADLCKKAYESGSAGYHFFTMNKPDLALNVLKLLNIY